MFGHSVVSDSLQPLNHGPPGSSVHGISQVRISQWLPFPTPGDLPDVGIESVSPAISALTGGFFTTEPSGNQAFKLVQMLWKAI